MDCLSHVRKMGLYQRLSTNTLCFMGECNGTDHHNGLHPLVSTNFIRTFRLCDLHPVSVQWEVYSAPDFSGLSWLCSHSKGDKSPKELCGLNRLYSPFHFSKCTRTSAMFSNQWVVKNSSRSFPLNDSQKTLSVGLPGREKQSFTPRRYAHASKTFPANSGPLSKRIVLGSP